MVGKFTSIAIVAAASAIFSTDSIAAPVDVDVQIAPPAPRVEVVPAPRRGYVWVPGYWDWRGQRHFWVAGTWVRARPGFVYAQPTWVNVNGHWVLHRGGWVSGPAR